MLSKNNNIRLAEKSTAEISHHFQSSQQGISHGDALWVVNDVYLERNIVESMLEINHFKEIQSFGTVSFAGQNATLLENHFVHNVHSYAEVHL